MSSIQIFSMIGSLLFLALLCYQLWKQRLKEAYAILWLAAGVVFLIFSVFTELLSIISRLIGIVYPPATLFLILITFIFLILFQYSLVLSKRAEEVKKLTQHAALLEERIRRLEEERKS